MKILLVADLHYNLKQYDWVTSVAGDFDLVVIAGDLLDIAGHADLDTQIVVVLKYLDRIRKAAPLLVSSGNHDGDTRNDEEEFIAEWLQRARRDNVHVDGDSYTLDEDLFTICPWPDGPVTRDGMLQLIEGDRERARKRWFWLHHAPPDASLASWTGKGYFGDADLNSTITEYNPQFVFSGHVHNAPFREKGSWVDKLGETWVFNAGREMGSLPAHIVVDLDAMRATWHSSMGTEDVDLTGPLPERVLD